MKKTLAAVAVLGAFAGSALAADVTLYGVVDTGFQYQHMDSDIAGQDAVDSFSMETGQQSGSRFGFKGTEDLGNGLTVGFILESQFNSDTGALKDDDHFFRRESTLFLQGGFGKVAFGRMGSINQGVSSWGKIGRISAFGTSWTNSAQVGTIMSTGTIYDNMISYETPSFAGVKVYAQYAMGSDGNENESRSNRYYSLGATYDNGPFAGYFAVDSINYKTADATGALANADDIDDSLTVTLGGSYNFDVAKVYFGAQYFDEVSAKYMNGTTGADGIAEKTKGWAVLLSADAPVAGGKAMFGVGYYDAEAADSATYDFDLSRWVVSVGYDYSLSKRTNVYGVATYAQDKYERDGYDNVEPSVIAVMVGLRHKF